MQLFKVESSEYLQLGILQIDQGTRIHDFGVSVVDKTVTLLLILKDYNGIYRVEPWVLQIHKFKNGTNSLYYYSTIIFGSDLN